MIFPLKPFKASIDSWAYHEFSHIFSWLSTMNFLFRSAPLKVLQKAWYAFAEASRHGANKERRTGTLAGRWADVSEIDGGIPSGKPTKKLWKITIETMGKSTSSMAMFSSLLFEHVHLFTQCFSENHKKIFNT